MKIIIIFFILNGIFFKGVGDVYIENGLIMDNFDIESKGVGNVDI